MAWARHFWLKVVSAVWVLVAMGSTAVAALTITVNDDLPVRVMAVIATVLLVPGLIMALVAHDHPAGRCFLAGRFLTYAGAAAILVRCLFQAGSDLVNIGGWIGVLLEVVLLIVPALLVATPSPTGRAPTTAPGGPLAIQRP